MIDRATKFPYAVHLIDITAKSVAEAFFVHWVSFFGVPDQIVSERRAQFSVYSSFYYTSRITTRSPLVHRGVLSCTRCLWTRRHKTALHPSTDA